MARTTNEFGGGEIVPSIETITGIQAPVREDFVAVPFGTVNHEHGERRQIQNQANNLKGSSGIERIPFNGIDELDTEQGTGTANAIGFLSFFGTVPTTAVTLTGTLTNGNGTVSYSLTFTPAAATLSAFTTALAVAWNANTNARLSEYTATGNGDSLTVVADAVGTAFNITVFNSGGVTGITGREGRLDIQPDGKVVYALNTGDSRLRFVGAGWVHGPAHGGGNDGTITRTTITGDYVEITFFGTALNLLTWMDNTQRAWSASVDGGIPRMIYPPTATATPLNDQSIDVNTILPIVSNLSPGIHTVKITRVVGQGGTEGLTLYGCEVINSNAGITQQPGADFDGRVELLTGTSFPIKPTNTPITSVNSRTGASEAFTGTTGARVLNYLTSGGQLKQSFEIADEGPVVTMAGEQNYTIVINSGSATGTVVLPASTSSFQSTLFGAGGNGGNTPSTFFVVASGGGGGGNSLATFTRDSGNTAALTITPVFGTSNLTSVSANSTIFMTASDGTDAAESPGAPGNGGTGNATVANITDWTRSATGTNTGSNGSSPPGGGGSGPGGNVGGFGNTPLTGNEGAGGASVTAFGTSSPGIAPGGGGSGPAGFNQPGGAGAAGRIYFQIVAAAGLTFGDFGVTTGEFTAGAISGAAVGSTTSIFGNTTFDTNRLNQEVIRRINFREFGANSAFANGSGNSQNDAFTLDDGTTTLVGVNLDYIGIAGPGETDTAAASRQPFALNMNNAADTLTITFVGTGLDVFAARSSEGTVSGWRLEVDGLNTGNIPDPGAGFVGIIPLVSGLSYGTHTVRILTTTQTARFGVFDFIIYGPKKPEIPTLDVGSLELSDYNIMGDHSDTPSSGVINLGKGLLRKIVTREMVFTGSWALDLASPTSVGGVLVSNAINGGELNYTFYGTGLEFRFRADSGMQLEFEIDDAVRTLATADFVGANTFTVNNASANGTANGRAIWSSNSNDNAAYIIDDLTLGVHTFTMRNSTLNTMNAGNFFAKSLDIITPIHINDDTLKIGSEGLNNLTVDPVVEEDEQVVLANLGEAKAWIHFNGNAGEVLSSYNISAVISTGSPGGGNTTWSPFIYFDKPFKDNNYAAIATPSLRGGGGGGDSVITFGANSQANFANFSVVSRLFSVGTTSVSGGIVVAFYGELIDE